MSEVTLFSSASRTANTNSDTQTQTKYKGVWLVLDITAASGASPTLDVKLQRYDGISGNFVDIADAAFAQQTGTATVGLTLYPGIAETANVSVSDVLTSEWRAVATLGGGTPDFTFSLAGQYIK